MNKYSMAEDVRREVVARLTSDYQFKPIQNWLRQGCCPECNRRELFVNADSPWVIKCGRENKCGFTANVRDLYPDAFGKFNEKFPATTEKPNATADAYMDFVRGFSPAKTKGWYRQGKFRHPYGNRETATVVFDISRGQDIFMERLIETVLVKNPDGTTSSRKANFVGGHKGLWWQPPGMKIKDGDEIWLVEGCLDAIALHMNGIKAVAILSCVNFPDQKLEAIRNKNITLVWALDNDAAGRRDIRKHVKKASLMGFISKAALIPQKDQGKIDWNDAHLARQLGNQDIERYRFHGDLLLAPSPMEKALLIWQRYKSRGFVVEFDKRTYWFSIIQETYSAHKTTLADRNITGEEAEEEAVRKAAQLHQIANCTIKFLYFQQSRQTDESWYYTKIEFPHGRNNQKNTFTGGQIATASELRKRLLTIAPGAVFEGNTHQLNWILKKYLDHIRTVETTDFIGYSKEHGIYVFNNQAVAAGRVIDINDEDFFEVGKTSIKSLNQSLHLQIGTANDYNPRWPELVYSAYGAKGLIATAFFFGSLFAEQIRATQKSYPFLEIVGEAGAGKSTLIEFLWKTLGRSDYEGFDPNKSTLAARARIFTQVSNLPVCLIESDREDKAKAKQFDWDELKTAYNGRASRARGLKNGGNETSEPPFRGSIVISQNAAVNASEAIMQRIIHTTFDTSGHTAASKSAADALASMPVENVSFFLLKAAAAEKTVLATIARRTPHYEKQLMALPDLRSNRIAKNHAQMMAMTEAMAEILNLPAHMKNETLEALSNAAIMRQRSIAADHPLIEEFWEIYEFLGENKLNHSRTPQETIAINLNHLQAVAHSYNQPLPPLSDLKKILRSSKSRRFIDIKAVNSANEAYQSNADRAKTVKCWVFDRGARK
ncbi:toprim domain-containing protein [Thalassospira marina]|nr:toprim domain-containing protein [Thalassospira marina]